MTTVGGHPPLDDDPGAVLPNGDILISLSPSGRLQ